MLQLLAMLHILRPCYILLLLLHVLPLSPMLAMLPLLPLLALPCLWVKPRVTVRLAGALPVYTSYPAPLLVLAYPSTSPTLPLY